MYSNSVSLIFFKAKERTLFNAGKRHFGHPVIDDVADDTLMLKWGSCYNYSFIHLI